MTRSARLVTTAAIACVLLLGTSLYLGSWGGVALVLVGAGGFAWYRLQVARGEEATDRFFADAGEDTRLPTPRDTPEGNPASPGEVPPDRRHSSPTSRPLPPGRHR